MNTAELRALLKRELDKLILKYDKRTYNDSLTFAKASGIVGITTGAGTALGTIAPGLGNAAGALVGLGVGLGIVGGLKINDMREKKKFNNAKNVLSFIGEREKDGAQRELLMTKTLDKVLGDREEKLSRLSTEDGKSVAKFLAAHMVAAIKQRPYLNLSDANVDTKVAIISDGLKTAKSKKGIFLSINSQGDEDLSLKSITRCSKS